MLSLFLLALAATAAACPEHRVVPQHGKRADDKPAGAKWAYLGARDWHTLDDRYAACFAGTQQSPIDLPLDAGSATTHKPTFEFPANGTAGVYKNWDYGFAWTATDLGSTVRVRFDNVSLGLAGWHIHTPAEHRLGGVRYQAEMHLVFVDAEKQPRAVFGVALHAGAQPLGFLEQMRDYMASLPGVKDAARAVPVHLDFWGLLGPVEGYFGTYWTYRGSLTTPPCTEGVRWFVAGRVASLSTGQMVVVKRAGRFSARDVNEVWRHGINV